MIILGIDPGIERAGYAIIKKEDGVLCHCESGIIPVAGKEQGEKLYSLKTNLERIIIHHKPTRVGIEKLFFANNQKTAMQIAEARGIILATLAGFNIPIKEYAPSEIKMGLVGNGRADKSAVAKIVRLLLKLEFAKRLDDEYDALAIALMAATRVY